MAIIPCPTIAKHSNAPGLKPFFTSIPDLTCHQLFNTLAWFKLQGSDVTIKTHYLGNTILTRMIGDRVRDRETMRQLIAKVPSLLDLGNDCGLTSLMKSIRFRNTASFNTLLELNAHVNIATIKPSNGIPAGATALWIAAAQPNSMHFVKSLITHGGRNQVPLTPFCQYKIYVAYWELAAPLKQKIESCVSGAFCDLILDYLFFDASDMLSKVNTIHYGRVKGTAEAIEVIDDYSYKKNYPLDGSEGLCDQLTSSCIDISFKDGNSALSLALLEASMEQRMYDKVRFSTLRDIEILLKAGADVQRKVSVPSFPPTILLRYAAERTNDLVVQMLLECGAEDESTTPLSKEGQKRLSRVYHHLSNKDRLHGNAWMNRSEVLQEVYYSEKL